MNLALKSHVVPILRERGFRGTLPHFRRLKEDRTELLTFQFNRYGGQFVVEVAVGPAERFVTYWGKEITPKKLTAHDLNDRLRLGPKMEGKEDYWFIFEGAGEKSMEELCSLLVEYIETEAEPYWASETYGES